MTGIPLHPLRLRALDRMTALRVPFREQPPDDSWFVGIGRSRGNPVAIFQAGATQYPVRLPYAPGEYFVKEMWATATDFGYSTDHVFYKASYINGGPYDDVTKWQPARTMPEAYARYLLTLGPPVPCRLGEVTEEMALSEGVPENANSDCPDRPLDPCWCPTCHGEGTYPTVASNLGVTWAYCTDCDTAVKLHRNMWDQMYPKHTDPGTWTWGYPMEVRKR